MIWHSVLISFRLKITISSDREGTFKEITLSSLHRFEKAHYFACTYLHCFQVAMASRHLSHDGYFDLTAFSRSKQSNSSSALSNLTTVHATNTPTVAPYISHHLRFFSRSASALAISAKSTAPCGITIRPQQQDQTIYYTHKLGPKATNMSTRHSVPAASRACVPPGG